MEEVLDLSSASRSEARLTNLRALVYSSDIFVNVSYCIICFIFGENYRC